MRTKYRLPYKVKNKNFEELEDAWVWCNTTLEHSWSSDYDYYFCNWGWEYDYCDYIYVDEFLWFFDSEEDAILFKLMWG